MTMPHFVRAAVLLGLAAAAIPAFAAAESTPYYKAVLVQPKAPEKVIANDLLWRGEGNTLTANQSDDRPMIVCQTLASNAGTMTSFEVKGEPMSKADLDKCNSKARK